MKSLHKQIYKLERELLKSETRMSQKKIGELLSEDFFEFCSSGNVYHYEEGDVFIEDSNSYDIKYEIIDFSVKKLSDDCMLATYKLIKHDVVADVNKYSLRSSIWKVIDGTWKMIFHQGTILTNF